MRVEKVEAYKVGTVLYNTEEEANKAVVNLVITDLEVMLNNWDDNFDTPEEDALQIIDDTITLFVKHDIINTKSKAYNKLISHLEIHL